MPYMILDPVVKEVGEVPLDTTIIYEGEKCTVISHSGPNTIIKFETDRSGTRTVGMLTAIPSSIIVESSK